MKLVFLIRISGHDFGGGSYSVFNFASHLAKLENDVTIFYISHPYFFNQQFKIPSLIIKKRIDINLGLVQQKGKSNKNYCMLYNLDWVNQKLVLQICDSLASWLIKNRSKNSEYLCWGYNFHWQSSNRYLEKGVPSIVNSSFIADAFVSLYEITGKKKYLDFAKSTCDFILNDLNKVETKDGICFSYTPIDNYFVHNANVLGASLLSRVYSKTSKEKYLELSTKCFDFTLSYQKTEGVWMYSIDLKNGYEREQIDWHQGFIIDSFRNFINYTKPESNKYHEAIISAAHFYRNEQFTLDGRSKWRLPYQWPADIHNQAQGIITFSQLSDIDGDYLDFAIKITDWTLSNMKDEEGYFYYQKWPFFINRIDYMRWNQIWMTCSLTNLIVNMAK